MRRRRFVRTPPGISICLLAPILSGTAVLRAADPAPDAVLTAQGLTKVSTTYQLEDDTKLPAGLRTMRQAKKQLDDATQKRTRIEKDIRAADNAIASLTQDIDEYHVRIVKVKNAAVHNELAAQNNEALKQLHEAQRFKAQREKDLKAVGNPGDDYISAVLTLTESMEATARRYTALAADPAVTAALAKLNETARPKLKLGPSAQFTQELPGVRRERDKINAAAIKFTLVGGVPHVTAVLNGNLNQLMVVDSGAASVTLTTEVAQKLGLTPGPKDPIVKMVSANGQKTDVHVMTLKSVRVGQFTVDNVECLILPPTVKDATSLLGGTFLRHFVFRLDLASGELRMAQLGGNVGVATNPKVSPTTAPTARAGRG